MKKTVHDLKPGQLAVVVNKPGSSSLNAFTKAIKPSSFEEFSLFRRINYYLDGEFWHLTTNIPHASLVFVVSRHKIGSSSTVITDNDVYKILYGENIYLIWSHVLINPHFNESET